MHSCIVSGEKIKSFSEKIKIPSRFKRFIAVLKNAALLSVKTLDGSTYFMATKFAVPLHSHFLLRRPT